MSRRLITGAMLTLSVALSGCNSVIAAVAKPDVQAAASEVTPGAYTLDTAHAALLFRIDHLGYSDYIGRFEAFDASLDVDPDQPETARLEAVVQVGSMNINNPEFRDTLLGADWFNAGEHPTASFKTTSAAQLTDTTGTVTGDLTLNGVTAPIIWQVTFNGAAYDRLRAADIIGLSATTTIDRTVFGIDKFSGLITDQVELELEAEFIKQ